MKPKIRCKHCHRQLSPHPRVKNQQFCGRKACQRARKSQWQRRKIATDADYRKNQQESSKNWQEQNRDYWSRYRSDHEHYRDRNRQLQKVRDARRRAKRLAKMDALKTKNDMIPGAYYLISIGDDLAKMDASVQKIFIIPDSYRRSCKSCKKGLDGHAGSAKVRCGIQEVCRHDVYPTLPGTDP